MVKAAIVSGATGGIGQSVVERLAAPSRRIFALSCTAQGFGSVKPGLDGPDRHSRAATQRRKLLRWLWMYTAGKCSRDRLALSDQPAAGDLSIVEMMPTRQVVGGT